VIASIHERRDEYRELLKPKSEAARQRHVARAAIRGRVMARRRLGSASIDTGAARTNPDVKGEEDGPE
jgi:hypothetical protein